MSNCKHRWIVYSTSLCPPEILLECENCEAGGSVSSYSRDEWGRAFHAPSANYYWEDPARVETN